MKNKNSVFPNFTQLDNVSKSELGLTKRELFAALAMQGLLANGSRGDFLKEYAVICADELIEELEKTNENDDNT
jgi:hypothetical protein